MRFHCFGDEPKQNESPKARDKVSTARHALGGKSFKHVVVFEQDFPKARGEMRTKLTRARSLK